MLTIKRNNFTLDFNHFVFPGGEVSVKLNLDTTAFVAKTNFFAPADYQTIIAKIKNSDDILRLLMAVDALRRIDKTPVNLFLPYCPYARQDRVCYAGESHSLKVFANLINSLNLEQVIIVDPHSNVCEAVFNNLRIITQLEVINKWTNFIARALPCKLVSPDAGANKKTFDLAQYFGHTDFVRADKLRNLSNGDIKEIIVYCDDFKDQDVLVCDDIADGARTFIELAKVCKKKNCGKFILYVTHGIFSKGLDLLWNEGIDEIWTTNSYVRLDNFIPAEWQTEKFKILNLEEKFEI